MSHPDRILITVYAHVLLSPTIGLFGLYLDMTRQQLM